MATSAKRYGLDVKGDIELETRLRRIEAKLETVLQASDLSSTASTSTQRVSEVPQVTGLRVLGKTPGAITLAWNQLRISDLRRYELDIAEDLAFTTNKQTFNVAGTEYQFSTTSTSSGGGNTSIYARVRARSRNAVGPYSAVLNTTTGQAQTADIASGAITTSTIATGAVTTTTIASGAVTTETIASGAVTAEQISSDDPIQFTGLDDEDVGAKLALGDYINGLILSNNSSDSDHDIDIATGVARDSTNILSITNSSILTKQIDAVWAAGTGSGGRASGTSLSASTPYFVFLLSDATGASVDAGFDTDPTASNLLDDTGTLLYYRRLGCVITDSSSNIYAFHQYGDFFQYDSPVSDPASYTTSAPSAGELTHTLTLIPVGISCRVQMTLTWRPVSSDNWDSVLAYASGYDPDLDSSTDGIDGGTNGDARTVETYADMLLSSAATFKTHQTNTDAALRLYFQIHSWVDLRGKDGTI